MCDSDDFDNCDDCLKYPCEVVEKCKPYEAKVFNMEFLHKGGRRNLNNIHGHDRCLIGVIKNETSIDVEPFIFSYQAGRATKKLLEKMGKKVVILTAINLI